MKQLRILVIGGGIGGLTAAIALGARGFAVDVIERDPDWSVYGVGIIQQSNVVRAMAQLGLLDDYLGAGFGFDFVEIYAPSGDRIARVPSPRLVKGCPANVGIARPALHKVLGERAKMAGATVRLGVTAPRLDQDESGVTVSFSDGSEARYDMVVGADGIYSDTRAMLFPDAPRPQFTGQSVWRHNFPRAPDIDGLHAYEGRIGVGLVPLSEAQMYMYVTTPEPGNPRYPRDGLAAAMRGKLAGMPPRIAALSADITDDDGVIYKPLETLMLGGPWHRGRVVLLGDAVHASTPHLGQGAGMAIEDAIVLADELTRAASPDEAFQAYRARRFERCEYIVSASRGVCDSQLGKAPPIDYAAVTRGMFETLARPI
ncbi:FAD-dependent oxidoreductase [Sphingomonas tabacisoli]|uniref:FAD-dependent oxidoreductase n=1 Tax=Sphingomonas tabacisoli TaxID=2249466 RepID=A0ABW4I2Y6_9SPHN